LSNAQQRDVTVTVESLSEDRKTVELQFDSTLRRTLPPLYLNEWMASNGGFIRDEDGDASDWFEIYNAGPFDIDPGGLYLTDNLTNPTQFQIPFGYTIPAGGHFLVWASGKNRRVPPRPLHANFLLATGGESLGLFAADGTRIDAVTFGGQSNNVSQGRLPDGTSNLVFFANSPTPAAANRLGPPPVTFRGFAHTALGAATLQLAGNRLFVGNLGSSGNDGVSVALGGAASFTMALDSLSLNNAGARMTISGGGLSGGVPNFSFGQASLSNSAGVVFVSADFRPIGDPNVLVEVWNAGQFVGSRTLPAGVLGRLTGNVVVTTVGKFSPSGAFPYCIPIDFLFPVTFTPLAGAGGAPLTGTQLRLLSAGAQVPVETIARFDLRFANIGGPVTILDEFRTTPQPVLNIARLPSGQLLLSWRSPNYVLQQAHNVTGPWEDVLGATSPYFTSAARARQFYRLRRDLSPDEVPDIEVPPRLGRIPLARNPALLPQGARGDLPAFDGDPFFVSLPAREETNVSARVILTTLIEPTLRAMGFTRGVNALLLPPDPGVNFPRGNLDGLAQALKFEYDNNPRIAGPQTSNMLNVFLGITQPNTNIDSALLMGEGMTFAQFKAGIERLEIQYPFQQQDGGVPIEHTMLVASRWEGQSVTTIFGTLFNFYAISNRVVIVESNAVAAGIQALGRARGIEQVTCITAEDGPHLLLLPYGANPAGITQMRYVWRMVLRADTVVGSSSFRLWLDAETGQILKMNMGLDFVSARGVVANRDPGRGTANATFQVDPAAGGQYVLSLAGAYNRVDYLNDGYDALDVSISSSMNGSSGSLANFNQAPLNDMAQGICMDGTNPGFQQVNLFATISRGRSVALSLGVWTPYPIAPLTPNIQVTGNCNANDDLNFFVCAGYTDPNCPDFVGANSGLNNALDNTVVSHEMGHTIQERLCEDRPSDWCGVPGCAISVSWQPLHDLADAWADHLESCNCEGGWAAKNTGGLDNSLYCANHNEAGFGPRFHWVDQQFNPASPNDHFPEHRALPGAGNNDYSDMQIATAALWQVRLGMRSKCRPSGTPQYAIRWARALKNTGLTGMSPGDTDTGIYRFLYDLEQKMMDQWATAGSPGGPPAFRHNGAHTANKVAAGFARTGVFLIPFTQLDGDPADPDNGGDAVIDITDNEPGDDYVVNGCPHAENDFLRVGGPAPTFHVWTGPRYKLDGAGGAATFNNPSPCNTKFRVEVSTSETFAAGPGTITSAFFNVDTNPATAGSPEGYGTWTPTNAEWTALQAGGAGSRIYYRARTRRADDTNERLSTLPGNGVWTVPPPYAVITANGMSDY
jgi:hypothetical protein